MKPTNIGYIEVIDGYVPTRPAPVITTWRSSSGKLSTYHVEVIDQHGNPHEFVAGLETERVAHEIAHVLTCRILQETGGEIISTISLAKEGRS